MKPHLRSRICVTSLRSSLTNTLINGSAIVWRPSGGRTSGWTKDSPHCSRHTAQTGCSPSGRFWILSFTRKCRALWCQMLHRTRDQWHSTLSHQMVLPIYLTTLPIPNVSFFYIFVVLLVQYILICILSWMCFAHVLARLHRGNLQAGINLIFERSVS